MKKTLIALAALAATGAFAQSTANLTGVVGFAQQQIKGVSGFTNTDATIAVTASEDLGGGLRATGAIQFDANSGGFGQSGGNTNVLNVRNKSVALSGGFGTISIANTRSGELLTRGMVAPSNLPEGMFDDSGVIARAPIDIVTYALAPMSGFAPSFSYVEVGDGGAKKTNRVYVAQGIYSAGPLAAGVALKSSEVVAAGTKKNNVEAFATYNLGVALVGVGYDQATSATSKAAASFGVSVPMGALTLGANYAARKVGSANNKVTEVVAKYDLSKRTSVNFSWGNQTADSTSPATGLDGKQHRLGLYHTF